MALGLLSDAVGGRRYQVASRWHRKSHLPNPRSKSQNAEEKTTVYELLAKSLHYSATVLFGLWREIVLGSLWGGRE